MGAGHTCQLVDTHLLQQLSDQLFIGAILLQSSSIPLNP
jgi:hypothetical protein